MRKASKYLALVGVLAGLAFSQGAFACTPPPIYFLNKTTPLDRKLPIAYTDMASPTNIGACPTPIWPHTFSSLTDAEVLQYLGANETGSTGNIASTGQAAPAWSATAIYTAGNLVSYGGKIYKARWWTQGETPGATSAVWEEQPDANGNPPGWQAATAYPASSKVSYQGNIYSAKWWTQGEVPGASNAWTLVGPIVQPVLKRPAPFQATVNRSGNSISGTWTSSFLSGGNYPVADFFEVRVNGVVVQQLVPQTVVADCSFESSPCIAVYTQSGSFSFSLQNSLDQFSLWLCAKNVCRPTRRIAVQNGATDAPGS